MDFIIVSGLPRTGTSLVLDIVEQASYRLGNVDEKSSYRMKRNECSDIKVSSDFDKKEDVKELVNEIDAMKCFGDLRCWYNSINDFRNVKVLYCVRDFESWFKSIEDLFIEVNREERINGHLKRGYKRFMRLVNCIDDKDWMIIPFTKLLEKNNDLFFRLKDFLDYDGEVSDLKSVVKPSVSKFGYSKDKFNA